MKTQHLIITILLVLPTKIIAQVAPIESSWTQYLRGKGWDMVNGIATDKSDRVYIAGGFTHKLKTDKKTAESVGNRDVYVARFNKNGKSQWLWRAGGCKMDKITAIQAAPGNDLYIAGIIAGEMPFGKKEISGKGKKLFLSRLNKQGTSDWVRTFEFSRFASGNLLEVSPDGSILFGGTFSGTLNFPKQALKNNARQGLFLSQFSPEGELLQLKHWEGETTLTAISSDRFNNTYLSGTYQKSFRMDSRAISAQEKYNSFIVRLNADFETQEHVSYHSPSYVEVSAMMTDEYDNLMVAGNFSNQIKSQDNSFLSSGLSDFFLAKYHAIDSLEWMRTYGGKYKNQSSDIKAGKDGNIVLIGNFADSLAMDSILLRGKGHHSKAFITLFNTRGKVLWAESLESNQQQGAAYSTMDRKGNVYITGTLWSDSIPGNEEDLFVAKYEHFVPEEYLDATNQALPLTKDTLFFEKTMILSHQTKGALHDNMTNSEHSLPLSSEAALLTIYPNPATEYVNWHLSIEPETPISLALSDVAGKDIIKEQIEAASLDRSQRLRVAHLPDGVYHLTIKVNAHKITRQVIKVTE